MKKLRKRQLALSYDARSKVEREKQKKVDANKTYPAGDSRSEGRGFESQLSILDGHFFILICCKFVLMFFEKIEMNNKEAGDGPFLKKLTQI